MAAITYILNFMARPHKCFIEGRMRPYGHRFCTSVLGDIQWNEL